MVCGVGYVEWSVAKCANRSAINFFAILCAKTTALMSVGGSVDKASFACLYRAIYVKFSLIYIILCFVENTLSFF